MPQGMSVLRQQAQALNWFELKHNDSSKLLCACSSSPKVRTAGQLPHFFCSSQSGKTEPNHDENADHGNVGVTVSHGGLTDLHPSDHRD